MAGNEQQREFWNGETARRWVENDARMERALAPVTDALLDFAHPEPGARALDVGCGCGNQTLALARALGPAGSVLGVDISEPMLAVARQRFATLDERVASTRFELADAADHAFPEAGFDLLFSRFGMMFFSDPAAAFRNMRQGMAANGRLAFACWQALPRNPWVCAPMQAVKPFVDIPAADPLAPGPFAFADADRVRGILGQAGFHAVAIEPLQTTLCFAEAPTLQEAAATMLQIGPVSTLLAELEQDTRAQAVAAATSALAPYYADGRLAPPVAIWLVGAKC